MTDMPNLGLPYFDPEQDDIEGSYNEAIAILDTLVMLSVLDRDLSAPPASPSEGDRYIVKAAGSGDFTGWDDQVVVFTEGEWLHFPPRVGWTCYVQDESALLAWNGTAWVAAIDALGGGSELQNISLLGIGTTADATNPVSATLNNVLWAAKTVADGGDGTLRYKLSKESEPKTLSFLFQDNFSGRAEIGLTGDDDFHFKVSADGSAWTDALVLDRASGAATLRDAIATQRVLLSGVVSPSQITADQDDYDPAGFATASTLRLDSDASRSITGLAGGADGRLLVLHNVGAQNIVLEDESASSSAANRLALSADVTMTPDMAVLLQYDGTSSRWRMIGGAGGGGSGYRLLGLQSFSASGTYTRSAGCTKALVEVWGGGGQGGGCPVTNSPANSISSAGGGGAGGYSAKWITPGATEIVTIGAGGSSGTTGNGQAGGTSSFGSHCSATGGGGGQGAGHTTGAAQLPGGAGGSGSGGDINMTGCYGGQAVMYAVGGTANPFYITGFGGAAPRGGGAAMTTASGNQGGIAGNSPGGGGSGAQAFNTATTYSGGAGAAGMVIVWEYA